MRFSNLSFFFFFLAIKLQLPCPDLALNRVNSIFSKDFCEISVFHLFQIRFYFRNVERLLGFVFNPHFFYLLNESVSRHLLAPVNVYLFCLNKNNASSHLIESFSEKRSHQHKIEYMKGLRIAILLV